MWEDPNFHTYSWDRQKQRFALVACFFSLNGEQWFNNSGWLDYTIHECDWFNRQENPCNEDRIMVHANFSHNNLSGTVPIEIKQLGTLTRIDVSHNSIEGILTPLAASGGVETFILSHNQFRGTLMGPVGFVGPDLRTIRLDGNGFEGGISGVFQYLPVLETLNITGNSFHGNIDPNLKHCSHLTYLGIADNELEGNVPTELGLLTFLRELDLSGNSQITGVFPRELSALNNSLRKLDISGTSLTGSIPDVLCQRQEEGRLQIKANCSGIFRCC